jgi:autotransporter-associated beta strand protein
VNVTAGRLIAVASGAIDPLDNATIALSGGALSLSSKGGTVTFDNALTVNNSGTLTAQQIASGVANGTVVLGSAARGVTVAGGQTLTLATADGYWLQLAGPMGGGGAVTLPGGAQVRLSHAGGLSVGGAVNVQNGAVLESSVAAPNLSQVNVNGGGILRLSTDPSGGIVPTPAVSGIVEANTDVGAAFDNLTFASGSTLRAINAARVYAGDIKLQGGQVNFGGAGQNLLLTGAVANGGSAGGINVIGGNTLTLSGPLTYTGTTNVNSGTLVLNSVLASPTVNVAGGSTLSIGAGGGLTSANVTVTNGTLRTTAPASLGNGPMTVNSAGQIQFSQGTGNTVTYSGTTINVNNGTLYAQSGITDLGGATIAVVPLITQAGLVEGRLGTGAFDETSPNPGGAVQLFPRMGETSSKPPWGDNETWVYTGQVYVTGTGVISFAENIDDNCKVVIDGVQRLRDTNWNTPTTTGIVSLTPNAWHDIEIRLGNGGGGAGPVAGNGWTSTYGFGYNPAGSASNQGTAYVVPQDNGSGNLFRTVTGGGTLRVDAGATLRAGAFTSATNVNLNGAAGNPAILRLADHASPTNSTATNLSLLGTNPLGTLDLGANNVLTVNNLSVAPGGTLTEQGAGTLVVSDALSLAAGSLLSVSGRVLVNGVGSGPGGVAVNSGGVLGGTGSIFGPTTVNNLGTLAPGAGQGILHTHDVAFSPGSIFQVELFGPAPGTGYDQLDVIGGVNLGDATLDLQLNYTPIPMSAFTIVNNDGVDPIVGSFLGLPEGSLLMRTYAGTNWLFDVTYRGGDGNDVVLTGYTPEPATLTLLALGGLMLLRRRRK